jgi:hypothetical protein
MFIQLGQGQANRAATLDQPGAAIRVSCGSMPVAQSAAKSVSAFSREYLT